MELIKLKPDCKDREIFDRMNEEAFPISERMSLDDAFALALDVDTDVLGLYDRELPVGLLVFVRNEFCGYLYYLAIDRNFRSRGYGSAALSLLAEAYPELQIILDFEEIDEQAENFEERCRRKKFYLRNGFHETGSYTMLWDIRFEVVCNRGELCRSEFEDLIHQLHAHRPEFPDALFSFQEIPV